MRLNVAWLQANKINYKSQPVRRTCGSGVYDDNDQMLNAVWKAVVEFNSDHKLITPSLTGVVQIASPLIVIGQLREHRFGHKFLSLVI